jgi:pimeloyl-ACP methyl ester carboxylesterase
MTTTPTLNVLIVHGVGWGENGTRYARPLRDAIQHEFDRAIRGLRLRDVNQSASRAKNALRFETVFWAPVTQRPQSSLLRVMFGRPGPFRRLNLTYIFRRNLLSLVGDVVAYGGSSDSNEVYRAIHEKMNEGVAALSEASRNAHDDSDPAPLTIIGHSLGSVIASDYVWDHTRSASQPHLLASHNLALINFIAMGSPMAMYALRNNAYGGQESIRESLDSPIQVDPDHGLWLNLYDRQDAIAFPLEPIESYQEAGVIDCTVQAGTWLTNWNLASHVGYWQSVDAARLIAGKLALDWARINSPRFAERNYAKALKAYRRELRRS